MLQVLVNLSESAYKEMCENGIDNIDYDIRQMMKNGKVINNDRSLCDSCATRGCVLQSGVVRKHCDFYTEEAELCEDTVKREDAIKAIDRHTFDTDDGLCLDEDISIILEELPHVTPARKKGMQEPVLDKIKAEIKEWYWQADKQALAKDPCVVDAMVDLFIRTIDKYKAGE